MRLTPIALPVSAIALLLSGAAQAQTATDWSGPYIAAHIGAGFQSSDDAESILFDTNLDGSFGDTVNTTAPANAFSPGFCGGAALADTPAGGCREDDEDFDFGLRGGYDWQFGSIVLGGLVEASRLEASDSVSAFSITPASYTMTRDLEWMVAARARAGVAFDRFLPYVTGGVAWAQVDRSFATTNVVNTFVQRDGDSAYGYQLGAGAEYRVTPSFSLGVEFIHTALDDGDFRVRAQGPAPMANPFILVNASGTDFARSDDDFEVQSLRATASYRF